MALDVSNICRSAFAVLAPVPRLVKLGFFASTAPVVCLSSEPGWFRALKAVRALAGTVPEAWNMFGDSHGSSTSNADRPSEWRSGDFHISWSVFASRHGSV